jgi:hypothetical protein
MSSHRDHRRDAPATDAQNRMIWATGRAENSHVTAARNRRSGCANNFRLCRGRLAALGSDSAYDHEILHTYSLPGIIMRGCHALISADPVVFEASAKIVANQIGLSARMADNRPGVGGRGGGSGCVCPVSLGYGDARLRPRLDVSACVLRPVGGFSRWLVAGGPVGGAGRVLTGMGRPSAGVGGSAILLPGALATGPGPCRAVRPHAGHGQRRALDRGQDGGQLLAGPLGGLALLLMFFGSGGGSSQPVAHRAEPAKLRPRLNDAIRRVEHQEHSDEASNDQSGHKYPALA